MSNSALNKSIRRRALVSKEDCPMALAAEMLGDRWTLLILREAFYGIQRYDDMLSDLKAPRSMLTDRLSRLVENKLMTRRAYQEPGSRVRHAYVLTEAGKALSLTFIALAQWGEEHIIKARSPVEVVEKSTGHPLRLCLQNEDGKTINPGAVLLAKRSD